MIGFHLETCHFHGFVVTSFDVGGRCRMRNLWRHYYYYQKMHAIVFVVDSTEFVAAAVVAAVVVASNNDNNNNVDATSIPKNNNNKDNYHDWKKDRVQMTRNELHYLLQDDLLQKNIPLLLLLCNKQDLPQAVPPDEIAQQLGLLDVKNRPWRALGCAAATTTNKQNDENKKNLAAGLDWIQRTVQEQKEKARMPPVKLIGNDDDDDDNNEAAVGGDTVVVGGTATVTSQGSDTATVKAEQSHSRTSSSSSSSSPLDDYDPNMTVKFRQEDLAKYCTDKNNVTLQRFRPIQQKSECPFAKSAKLWGGPTLDDIEKEHAHSVSLEEQAKANIKYLVEFVRQSNVNENVDGYCIELNDPQAISDSSSSSSSKNNKESVHDFGQAVRCLLLALSDLDPAGDGIMRVKYIGARGWRFRFAKADLFVTTFAPCYPITHSRYAHGTGRAFVLLQPELSFVRHRLPVDTAHTNWDVPQTIRDKARVAFWRAGRPYVIPKTTNYPPAEHIVKPFKDDGTTVVRWWEEKDNNGGGSSSTATTTSSDLSAQVAAVHGRTVRLPTPWIY